MMLTVPSLPGINPQGSVVDLDFLKASVELLLLYTPSGVCPVRGCANPPERNHSHLTFCLFQATASAGNPAILAAGWRLCSVALAIALISQNTRRT